MPPGRSGTHTQGKALRRAQGSVAGEGVLRSTSMQGSLFDQSPSGDAELPPPGRMPLNHGGRQVHRTLMPDLLADGDALVVTGYSGLDQLIRLVSQRGDAAGQLRLLLGSEPSSSSSQDFSLHNRSFEQEVRSYWLSRGISLRLSGQLIHCIELLRNGLVSVRYPGPGPRVHAKIYCTQVAVTLGSSNFTAPGLHSQHEANARFTPKDEPRRYREIWQYAEFLWEHGTDAKDALLALLENLLRCVTWREALARACAELLEGDWAPSYLESLGHSSDVTLWPSQRKGIGQALYLIETVGGVLIADATGSGKTRMGVHLLRAVYDRIWSASRGHKGLIAMVCPPLVLANWERESLRCFLQINIRSHGALSHSRAGDESVISDLMVRSQTLAVDEAHNFLSQTSNRSRQLVHNLADQVVLFTATPFNRSASDLLRMIDILGADNFDDQVLASLERLTRLKGGLRDAAPEDLATLKSALAGFMVRRTKKQLNSMVDLEPDAYRLSSGRVCRYPEHHSQVYELNESANDIKLAGEILAIARSLVGITHFEKALYLPESHARSGMSAEAYLQMRLKSAKGLACHHVMASLRSSRLALFRHILGEREALQRLHLQHDLAVEGDDTTGNMRERITALQGRIPENRLGIELPDWLSDQEEHRRECEAEVGRYTYILMRLERMSDGREQRKCQLLLGLARQHEQVIAFDHFPLTLRHLQYLMARSHGDNRVEVLLGVGGKKRQNQALQARLDPERGTGRVIALCSDALSEGVNLQRASAMVHLDMPSVVRYAEQRVGRIDRMDSPHDSIECWWPRDADTFALKADERFIARVEDVESSLGGNLQLPDALLANSGPERLITPEQQQQELEERASIPWDGVEDAFAAVRGLLEGDRAMLTAEDYTMVREETLAVLSRVSLVKSDQPWLFVCLAGEAKRAPRWVLIVDQQPKPLVHLPDIVEQLRQRLGQGQKDLPLSHGAGRQLERFLVRLSEQERLLLPQRKQRALDQMQDVISVWASRKGWIESTGQADAIQRLLQTLKHNHIEGCPDWAQLADAWLDLVRPTWFGYLNKVARRSQIVRLRDIRKALLAEALPASTIIERISGIALRQTWEERIVACVLGYSGTQTE